MQRRPRAKRAVQRKQISECTKFEIEISSRSGFCSSFAHHLKIFFVRKVSLPPKQYKRNGLDALFMSNLSRNGDCFHRIYLIMCYYNANSFLHIWIRHSLRIMPIQFFSRKRAEIVSFVLSMVAYGHFHLQY